MPQTNYTPILIYASGTTGNTPAAGNLTNSSGGSELAINYFDGKLFYKDASNVVRVLASRGTGTIGGSDTQVQFNSSGALAGSANLTFNGTSLTLGGNPTLSAGVAGGVLYLNGSKVATSAANFVFDGYTFATGLAGTGNYNTGIQLNGTNASGFGSTITGLRNSVNTWSIGDSAPIVGGANASLLFYNYGTLPWVWQLQTGGEQMRLTSTGLGIGTSSPTAKLHVEGNTNANSAIFFKNSNSAATAFVSLSLGNDVNGLGGFKYTSSTFTGTPNALLYSGDYHVFNTIAGVERMRLDTSGNLGIGTTSPQTRLHAVAASAADVEVARFQNPYTGTGSASITIGDTGGSTYRPFTIRSNWTSGPGVVFIANRDIAGRGFDFRNNADTTSLFFIESTGNIGVGVTPSAWSTGVALQTRGAGLWDNGVNNTYLVQNAFFNGTNWIYRNSFAASQYLQIGGAHQWWTAPAGTAGNTAVFTQAMTLDASGNLGIGTTSPSNNLDVFSSAAAITVRFGSSSSNVTQLIQRADASSEGKITFRTGGTENWSIGLFAATSNALQFFASGAERLRISSAGNQIATQPAESAQNANATLTVANLQTRIITSNAAVTLTLPTGTDLDTYATSMATNTAFECTFIATTANAITIAANGNTTVGSLTVAGNTSGTFRFRKTAANTFTVYRVA